jgi:respiratory burst oxidase
MLGYWLVFPALLVTFERTWRFARGFMSVPARAKVLDSETMEITCTHPKGQDWQYSAGQYILLQIPKISLFQWHPFTISSCRGDILQVHIKFDGDWTKKLAEVLPNDEDTRVGIDGPFGAPAQRFYDYKYSIIVGGGIGVTPFSAILTDLEDCFTERKDPWAERRRSRSISCRRSRQSSRAQSESDKPEQEPVAKHPNPDRRIDFHWTVREKNNLLWFSDLLNRAIEGSYSLSSQGNLEVNINTHITAKRKNISTHIFRYLLDSYRTPAAPYSALTGLKQPSHFGRPDFDTILEKHFDDLVQAGVKERKVGVFVSATP